MNDLKNELRNVVESYELNSKDALSSVWEFRNGYVFSLTRYAHWKDGIQYVGSTGLTLREAIREIDVAMEEIKKEKGW